jgi:hypothetical protein
LCGATSIIASCCALCRYPHTYPFFPEPSSLALLPIPTPATPPRPFPTLPPYHLDAACTDRGASERAPASTNSIISFLFPRRPSSSTLVGITHSLQVPSNCVGRCPAHHHTLSTTHARCVRLTLACQSLRPGPIDGLLLGDTNLQFPDFSSLHTFSKPKPITKPLSTSRLNSIRRPERGYTPPDRPRRSISKRILKRKLCRRSPLAHRLTGITLSD